MTAQRRSHDVTFVQRDRPNSRRRALLYYLQRSTGVGWTSVGRRSRWGGGGVKVWGRCGWQGLGGNGRGIGMGGDRVDADIRANIDVRVHCFVEIGFAFLLKLNTN